MRLAALLLLALIACGEPPEGVTPESLVNEALAALGANDLANAEGFARRAAELAADSPRAAEFSGLRDFLLGNVAFARCQRAKTLANLPDADPKVLQGAIAQADAARRAWELAATSRVDWPAARRNVERALLELEALRGRAPSAPPKDGPDEMKKDNDPQAKPADPDGPPPGETPPLDPEQLKNLLERLAELEQEKQDARRSRAGESAAGVERDW